MIGSLRGNIIGISYLENPQILLEVDGIGYRISVGKSAVSQLDEEGSEILLYISHQIREDSEILYGFIDIKDRDTFEILLKIHKVGPALAKDILDCYGLEQLEDITLRQDVEALTSISGVGKTTAERLLTELKNKLSVSDLPIDTPKATPGVSDVKKALLELGYSNAEIRTVLKDLPSDLESQELLKQALALLAPEKDK